MVERHAGRIVIWGASGHAKVVADIARQTGWEVLGFLDDVNATRRGAAFFGGVILGGFHDVLASGALPDGCVLGLGVGNNVARLAFAREALTQGLPLAVLVHPSGVLGGGVQVGPGTVVAAGALVNPDVFVGEAGLVNTGASIDHDCIVGPGAHVAPHATLAGAVRVGERSLVGAGAVVLPGIVIGRDVTVGAGSTVTRDLPDGVTAVGAPARVLRTAGAGPQ